MRRARAGWRCATRPIARDVASKAVCQGRGRRRGRVAFSGATLANIGTTSAACMRKRYRGRKSESRRLMYALGSFHFASRAGVYALRQTQVNDVTSNLGAAALSPSPALHFRGARRSGDALGISATCKPATDLGTHRTMRFSRRAYVQYDVGKRRRLGRD